MMLFVWTFLFIFRRRRDQTSWTDNLIGFIEFSKDIRQVYRIISIIIVILLARIQIWWAIAESRMNLNTDQFSPVISCGLGLYEANRWVDCYPRDLSVYFGTVNDFGLFVWTPIITIV